MVAEVTAQSFEDSPPSIEVPMQDMMKLQMIRTSVQRKVDVKQHHTYTPDDVARARLMSCMLPTQPKIPPSS